MKVRFFYLRFTGTVRGQGTMHGSLLFKRLTVTNHPVTVVTTTTSADGKRIYYSHATWNPVDTFNLDRMRHIAYDRLIKRVNQLEAPSVPVEGGNVKVRLVTEILNASRPFTNRRNAAEQWLAEEELRRIARATAQVASATAQQAGEEVAGASAPPTQP